MAATGRASAWRLARKSPDKYGRRDRHRVEATVASRRGGATVPSVADRGRGALEAAVGSLVEQEGGDVGAGDTGADSVAGEVAGADGGGAGAVGGAREAHDRSVEGAVGD